MATPALMLHRTHIRPGDRLCAAVSGGADSVALLLLLRAANELPRNALGIGLSAIHVHHGLRGEEADADLAFVQALCARLGVLLHVHHASVPDRITRSRGTGRTETVEEAARELRYAIFQKLLAEGAADSILTAHTLDDQAETVLMKFLRGAWTEGLSGIHPVVLPGVLSGMLSGKTGTFAEESASGIRPPNLPATQQRGKIVRPLLAVRHAQLCSFLESRSQPWREDSTNTDPAFTRNRIRHHLLPLLREFNPGIDQALANLAELAREDEASWATELALVLPQLLLPGKPVRGGGRAVGTAPGDPGTVAIELERLRPLDPALRRRVLRAAARSLGARLSFNETARLLDLAGFSGDAVSTAVPESKPRSGTTLHFGSGLRAERSARELRLFLTPES
jgi:tRNA(Ile)-lysidine synthase